MKEAKLESLERLLEALITAGVRVVGPRRDGRRVVYAELDSPADYTADYIAPANSPKEFLFPKSETILEAAYDAAGVKLEDKLDDDYPATVILGVRPCDARGLASLDEVFSGEYADEFYLRRRAATTIFAVSCLRCDTDCFCTSTGGGPDDHAGSDLLLTPLKGGYFVEAVTVKGSALLDGHAGLFTEAPQRALRDRAVAGVNSELRADLDGTVEDARRFLQKPAAYDDERWERLAYRCLSCGACTFVCPTCHCYDIVDEGKAGASRRKKNWDACQFDHFTLHASGHNPRSRQPLRWRNRFACKFKIYPERWGVPGCVGCGRCIRVCPVGQDITETLAALATAAGKPSS